MSTQILDKFRAALKYYLAKEGYGAQAHLARKQDIDRGYLNAIIQGRKGGSDAVRTQIVKHFNTNLEDMLILGQRILSDEKEVELLTAVLRMDLANLEIQQTEDERPRVIIFDLMKAVYILKSGTRFASLLADFTEIFYKATLLKEENQHLHEVRNELKSKIHKLEKQLTSKQSQS